LFKVYDHFINTQPLQKYTNDELTIRITNNCKI